MNVIEKALSGTNPYVKWLIGTLRRVCLDHVLIFGERHLRRVPNSYSFHYHEVRTPILSGLHHRYARMIFGKDRGPSGTCVN